MPVDNRGPVQAGRVLPMDALYREAVGLAEAARGYLDSGPARDARDPAAHLAVARETTRLVSRLGYSLAWLLARQAVQAGEITPEDAARGERWRLGGRSVCLAGDGDPEGRLPHELAELLGRSDGLYRRLDRLDRQLERPPGTPRRRPGRPAAPAVVSADGGI